MRPEILVLDEPTTFLDPPSERALVDLLHSLPQAKIVATHDISFAAAVAQRAVFFEGGTVAGEGPVSEIVNRFGWSGAAAPRSV
jgi:cobalt/nickel transport system ATP-binding protein